MPGDIGDIKPIEPISGTFAFGQIEDSKVAPEHKWLANILETAISDHVFRMNFLESKVIQAETFKKTYDSMKGKNPNASHDELNFEAAKTFDVDNYTTGVIEPKDGKLYVDMKINRVKDNKTLLSIKLHGTERQNFWQSLLK